MEKEKLLHLNVILGDEVMDKENKRLGWIHKKGVFGNKNSFIITWLDDGSQSAFCSKKSQQQLIKTGRNFYHDSSDDED